MVSLQPAGADAGRSYYNQRLLQSVTNITEHLHAVRERVRIAAEKTGRKADDVLIVAVSKQQPVDAMQLAYQAGQRHFGESYAQEAEHKLDALADLDVVWHFIGRVQANKTRFIAERFAWVHTVDRERVARRLNAQRPHFAPQLNVLIQVNVGDEPQKAGVAPQELDALADSVRGFERLALRGLMTIPPAGTGGETRRHFENLAALLSGLNDRGFELDTLSMGMSGDFESAIAAGSTCVRLGTALFGPRPY